MNKEDKAWIRQQISDIKVQLVMKNRFHKVKLDSLELNMEFVILDSRDLLSLRNTLDTVDDVVAAQAISRKPKKGKKKCNT